jgi:hypothetical protein
MSHRERRYFSLITVSVGFVAASVGSFGADPGPGYTPAIAVPSDAAPAARQPLPTHPIDPPDTNPDRYLQHARMVDRLYEELMHSSECFLASSNASITSGC